MPGNVGNAVPATVYPWKLTTTMRPGREFATEMNEYADGRSQRRSLVTLSRRSWQFAHRLTPADLATLRAFFEARNGEQEAFWFYDVRETSPQWSFDPTGVATVGRYTVRFEGGWNQRAGFARLETELRLVEVA